MLTLRTTATITKINRKSSSPCFKDLKVGDVIEFSVPIKRAGSNKGQTYSTYILCHNRRTGQDSGASFNQIGQLLECCELVEGDNILTDDKFMVLPYDAKPVELA